MSLFVILCAVMALVAIFLVAWPLIRPLQVAGVDEPSAPKAAPLAFALTVALILGSAGLYASINNFPWTNPQVAEAVPPGHGAAGDAGSMEQVTSQLEARLAQNPADAEGWRMLGRTYLVTGNAAKAAQAYERAASLSSEKDPALELDLAEALVLTDDPAQLPRAKQIFDDALAADPNSQKALWYRGVMASRAGDKETAKTSWMKLIEQNPPPEIREIIANQLRELGVEVPAAPGGAPPAMAAMGGGMAAGPAMGGGGAGAVAPQGRTVRVTVKLDPALAGKVTPGLPLFVSAREPGIPGPPIAALRLSTDQIGQTVVLSDANTMIEGRTLSSVNDVEIVARVAFAGTPAITSGDLLGSVVQKKGGAEDVEVTISKVQP
jgi:cytochrome c-type biogenesis protein CcmH